MMAPKAATMTLPGWARVLAIVVGIVSLILGVIVLLIPTLGLLTLVFLLAIAFLFIGIDRLIAGITGHPYSLLMPVAAAAGVPEAPKPPQ
jgi:hypothetical protein